MSQYAKLLELDAAFTKWLSDVESLCQNAVYRGENDLMKFLWQNLDNKVVEISNVKRPLEGHLEKIKKDNLDKKPIPCPHDGQYFSLVPVQKDFEPRPVKSPIILNNNNNLAKSTAATEHPAFKRSNLHSVRESHTGNDTQQPEAHENENAWSTVTRKNKYKEKEKEITKSSTPKLPNGQSVNGNAVVSSSSDTASVSSLDAEALEPRKIFLNNLNKDTDPKKIASFAVQFGSVVDVFIFRTADGTSCGYATVEYLTELCVQKALQVGVLNIDGREVVVKPCYRREANIGNRRFHVFLPGVPTFLSEEDVRQAVEKIVKVHSLKFDSDRGFALIELENPKDLDKFLAKEKIKIGEKLVEVRKNNLRK